jgi:hypothetical protein
LGLLRGEGLFSAEDDTMEPHERDAARAHQDRQTAKDEAQRRRRKKSRRDVSDTAAASRAVRRTFRQLASRLHPDRATNTVDAAQKTIAMQRANVAYRSGDLLDLLALQRETSPGTPASGLIPEAQLAAYNRALEQQLAGLQENLREIEAGVRDEFGLSLSHRPHPGELTKLLKGDKQALLAAITRLQATRRRLAYPDQLLPWLKEQMAKEAAG